MRRVLAFGCILAALSVAGAALAVPRFRIIVPVEIENLPSQIVNAQLECQVSSARTFDASRVIGEGRTEIAIEGGRYSGRVGVEVTPRGSPVGTDGTVEGRSFVCTIFLRYRCTASLGEGAWCTSGAGGAPIAGSSETVARLFTTDPGRTSAGTIEGTIDRASAETLP